MNNKKRIGINMVSGAAGYILPMLINVVSAPYVLAKLGEEAYGLQVLANVIIGYLIVADMGLDIPVTQRVAEFHARKESIKLSEFLLATMKIYLLIGFAGFILLVLFTQPLIKLFDLSGSLKDDATMLFYLAAIGFFGSIINMWGKAVFNGLHRYEISNGVNVAVNLVSLLFGIILIVNGYGVVGFFGARVIGFIFSSCLYLALASKHLIKITFKPWINILIWTQLKTQIGYGFALRVSGMILSKLDQTFIGMWVGISIVASYSFSLLIATTLSGIISSLTHFAFPMVASMEATKSKEKITAFFYDITKFISVIATLIFIPFILYSDIFLRLWISPEIADQNALVITQLLLAFYINTFLTTGLTSFVVGSGHLKYFTGYGFGRGAILVLGFFLLIRSFGLAGAGYSYLISVVLDFLYVLYTSKTKFQFSVHQMIVRCYVKPILIGALLAIPMFLCKPFIDTWIKLISCSSLFVVLYLVLGYVFKILSDSERHAIMIFFKMKPQ